MLRTSSSSIVVTSTASESALEEDHPRTQDEEEEVRSKPRGFFADQFEVIGTQDPDKFACVYYYSTVA